jgi:hypothetical protein
MDRRCELTLEEALLDLLRLSLVAWRIGGEVRRGGDGALIVTASSREISVRRAPQALPFRWTVSGERVRVAMSVTGVLGALRVALDPDYRPARLRIGLLPLAPPGAP